MDRGYIKLWRKLQDNKAIYHDSNCLALLIHLLFMAEWKEGRKVWFNGKELPLMTGQLTTGRKQLAVSVGLSERNIRTCLDKLTKMEIVTIETTSKYSLITILNWETYQQTKDKNDQQTANDRPTTDQQVTTIKEYKNKRIKEYNIQDFIPSLKATYTNIDVDSEVNKMRGWILSHPNRKLSKSFVTNWLNRAIDNQVSITEVNKSPYVGLPNQKF
jgi:hypothetical protein